MKNYFHWKPRSAALYIIWLLLAAYPACCETRVHGILSKDVKWTLDNSPYLVEGDVVVARNARLIIAPGVTVLFSSHPLIDKAIRQYDRPDSFSTAIKVLGGLDCVGKREKRIVFQPASAETGACSWYGIVFDNAPDNYVEMAFCDITGAYYGVTAVGCAPLVRNCVIEQNNIGVNCLENGGCLMYNCNILRNITAGIKVRSANPVFYNNIVAFNRNNGVWCDGISRITFQYNCLWGNADGDFLECDPEMGVVVAQGKKKTDSLDNNHNVCKNPVFAGSPSDSLAVERDLSLQTDKSRVVDTALSKLLSSKLTDSLAVKKRLTPYPRYLLSRYSPCVNAGNPAREFNNSNGSRNDMGVYGGPDYTGYKGK